MNTYSVPVGDYTPAENVNQKVVRLFNEYRGGVEAAGGKMTWVKSWSLDPAQLILALPNDLTPDKVGIERPFSVLDPSIPTGLGELPFSPNPAAPASDQ